MQRMKLHLSGVKLPRLGSLQDRVYREYMFREAKLEAKKAEMFMLMTLTNPDLDNPNQRREWGSTVKDLWSEYLAMLMNVEMPEKTEKEVEMLEYYQSVVKKAKLKLFKTRDNRLNVSGVEQLL